MTFTPLDFYSVPLRTEQGLLSLFFHLFQGPLKSLKDPRVDSEESGAFSGLSPQTLDFFQRFLGGVGSKGILWESSLT